MSALAPALPPAFRGGLLSQLNPIPFNDNDNDEYWI